MEIDREKAEVQETWRGLCGQKTKEGFHDPWKEEKA